MSLPIKGGLICSRLSGRLTLKPGDLVIRTWPSGYNYPPRTISEVDILNGVSTVDAAGRYVDRWAYGCCFRLVK